MKNDLSSVSKTILFKEPFYGLFLIGLKKEFTDQVPTAGVSKNNIGVGLYINPDFFNSLNDDKKYGLIKHELLHIAFGHLIVRDMYADKKLFNIAADLEINQYINRSKLPEGGLTLDTFPDLNLPYKAGTKKYYEILQQANKNGTSESLSNLLDTMDGNSQYCHPTWDEFDEVDEATKKLIQKQVDYQINEVAQTIEKSQGHIPGEISSILERIRYVEPQKFDWKRYLRMFVGNSAKTYTKKTRRKRNKRFDDNPAIKVKTRNHILVGIDTSGSVNNDELNEFMNELWHIQKTGNEITVAQCDTEIVYVGKINLNKDIKIHGRGGTSFQPVVDLFNEEKKYTTLIYFTDGEATSPYNCPKNTLWVLSSCSNLNNELPGKVIKIEK
jgi:predicted metal-dependent peptidase